LEWNSRHLLNKSKKLRKAKLM